MSPCLPSCMTSNFVTPMQQKPDVHADALVYFRLFDHEIADFKKNIQWLHYMYQMKNRGKGTLDVIEISQIQ